MRKKEVIIITIIFFIIFCILFFYEKTRKTPNDIFLGNLSLAHLDKIELQDAVQKEIEKRKNISFEIFLGEKFLGTFYSNDFGIVFDVERTITKIFDDMDPVINIFRIKKLSQKIYTPIVYFDQKSIQNKLQILISKEIIKALDAKIIWEKQKWFIRPSTSGFSISSNHFDKATEEIISHLRESNSSVKISVEYEKVEPSIYEKELKPLLSQLVQFEKTPIDLLYKTEKIPIYLNEFENWIEIDEYKKKIHLNRKFAQNWIDDFSVKHNKSPGVIEITGTQTVVSEYDNKNYKKILYTGDFSKGELVEKELFIHDLSDFVKNATIKKNINLQITYLNPKIISKEDVGEFSDLVSTGITSYKLGNYSNRVKNIKLSLESLKGVLMEPQEEFSFNRVTGWITEKKGYKKTKIIIDGRIEEGLGGGVCQTSTTLYRAVISAGLPIVERRSHSLDVAYYHEYGYGLDASVYTEARSDLRFFNDYSTPLLINIFTNDLRNEAFIEFFGKKDKRKVELKPIQTNNPLIKRWNWIITWPEKIEERIIESKYILPQEKKLPLNPLEG